MRGILRYLSALLILVIFGVGCYFLIKPKSEVAVTVNGTIITQDILDSEIARLQQNTPDIFSKDHAGIEAASIKQATLDDLIDKTLLLQEAKRRRISVSSREVNRVFDAYVTSYPNPLEYEEVLENAGMSEHELKAATRDNLTIKALVESLVPAIDELNDVTYLNEKRAEALTELLKSLRESAVIE